MNYKTVFRWLPKKLVLGIIISMIFTGLGGVVMAEVMGYVSRFNESKTNQDILYFLISTLGIFFVIYSMFTLNMKLIFKAIRKLNENLKRNYLLYELNKEVDDKRTAEKMSILVNDFKLVEEKYFNLLLQVYFNLTISLFTASYMIYLDIYLGSAFIILSFLIFLPAKIWEKELEEKTKRWTKDSGEFLQRASDLLKGTNLLHIYQAEEEVKKITFESLHRNESSLRRMKFSEDVVVYLSTYLSILGSILPILFGLILIIEGKVEASLIIALNVASNRVSYPFQQVADLTTQMKTTKGIRNKIQNFLHVPVKAEGIKKVQYIQKPTILIDNLGFNYTNGKLVFENINLIIPYGEKILITGKSGSGKTTLLNLIQGELEPSEGKLLYSNGETTFDAKSSSHLDYFSRIAQTPFIFTDTLKFNLSLGQDFKKTKMIKVLEEVDLIAELGEDCLDKSYGENGAELSGGQKQRVEIARALLFEKPILLVDEATANLDENASKKIRDILWKLPQTVIEIAHHYDPEDIKKYDVSHYGIKKNQLIQKN